MSKPCEQFEHTADIGLRIRGADLAALLQNAADGLIDLMFDPAAVRPVEERAFVLEEANAEELLVSWLQRIVILLDAEQFLCAEAEVRRVEGGRLEACLRGERLDADRHEVRHAVKAITYHDLAIRKTDDGLMVEIICDV